MTHSVQQTKVDDRILELVQQTYEMELDKQNIALSPSERKRLFRQVLKAVLTDMLGKIESTE
jgi:hypothetical protein